MLLRANCCCDVVNVVPDVPAKWVHYHRNVTAGSATPTPACDNGAVFIGIDIADPADCSLIRQAIFSFDAWPAAGPFVALACVLESCPELPTATLEIDGVAAYQSMEVRRYKIAIGTASAEWVWDGTPVASPYLPLNGVLTLANWQWAASGACPYWPSFQTGITINPLRNCVSDSGGLVAMDAFHCALSHHAIDDFWASPPTMSSDGPGPAGSPGISLVTYAGRVLGGYIQWDLGTVANPITGGDSTSQNVRFKWCGPFMVCGLVNDPNLTFWGGTLGVAAFEQMTNPGCAVAYAEGYVEFAGGSLYHYQGSQRTDDQPACGNTWDVNYISPPATVSSGSRTHEFTATITWHL